MASLEHMKKIMSEYGTDNFLSLVADVLFNDVSEIREFKIHDMYYVHDIVLVPASVSGEEKDRLFICKRNGVKGNFNPNDWTLYTVSAPSAQGLVNGEEKDRLFICKRNGVKGNFNPNDWTLYTVSAPSSQGLVNAKRYTASADNTSTINLGFDISLEKTTLLITHSVRGKLVESVDWEMQDRRTLRFKNFTLFEGEYVDIDFYE